MYIESFYFEPFKFFAFKMKLFIYTIYKAIVIGRIYKTKSRFTVSPERTLIT